jgi:type II secretory pathway pseudopilin PulG
MLGYTLIEVVLVLVIASSIALLGMRFYTSLRADADVRQIQYNVKSLFQSMRLYYQLNCYGTTKLDGTLQPGTLNPLAVGFTTLPHTIKVVADLKPGNIYSGVYPFPLNAIIDTAEGESGYFLQFNYFETPRKVCTEVVTPSTNNQPISPYDTNCKTKVTTSTIIFWKSIIAVQLKAGVDAKAYLSLLNGDCISSFKNDVIQTILKSILIVVSSVMRHCSSLMK